ncbi:MAG: response regulator [Deltaproteobacteria bacterium]|nr:response regulator [Deltaproteobacteria bacterium]
MKKHRWSFRFPWLRSTVSSEPADELQQERRRTLDLEQRIASIREEHAELQEREARFRILSELVTDCCWARWGSTSGATHRVWVNDAFETLTGYSPEEFEEVGREGLVHPEDFEVASQFVDGPPGINEHQFRIVRKDGQVRWLREKMLVEQKGGSLLVLGATQDITAQKQAEELLKQGNRSLEDRVRERTRALEDANRRLQEEILQRQRTEEALRQARDEAEEASQAKSRFLANMSHEMRTPLNGVTGLADLLLGQALTSPARKQVEMLRSSADMLMELIERVLDFSKIEADRLTLENLEFTLEGIEKQLIGVFSQRALEKDLELQIDRDSEVPDRLWGDAARLRQILLNLVDNALKFTRRGSVRVRVEVHEVQKDCIWLRFLVRDSGVGIPQDGIRRLFEPFSQGDQSTARHFGGTGLGLTISQRLAQLMGGEIDVESVVGEGSTFRLLVPFRLGPLPKGPTVPPMEGESSGVSEAAQPFGQGYRVLVAEDNSINQVVIASQLEVLGIACQLAVGGLEALAALEKGSFDLILMDCQMPGLDGYQTTERIRQGESEGHRAPIIALTASAVQQDLDRCFEAGMDDVLSKPYREDQLRAVLNRWLPPRS